MTDTKPRIRVQARSAPVTATDSYQNFSLSLGMGTNNALTQSTYGLNPITRNRLLLEWIYRGSWIVRAVVDAVADDMTREGIELQFDDAEKEDKILKLMTRRKVWASLNQSLKWSRLYGGALCVILIKGQALDTPLIPERVEKDSFAGLVAIDRWMIQPSYGRVITEVGPNLGLPEYYDIVAGSRAPIAGRVHHSRVIRFEGDDIPFNQKQLENGWGLSVVEPLYDRLIAFDSTTTGVAQLVYKAHLRTLKIPRLREAIAAGGQTMLAVSAQVQFMKTYQGIEGLTIIDGVDEFDTHSYTFAGLSDTLVQFSTQLSGASGIPLVRLFGQSPSGFSTGDTDMRNYYDKVSSKQQTDLYDPLETLLHVMYWSEFQSEPSEKSQFEFKPLWQLTDTEKADIAGKDTETIIKAFGEGIISEQTALEELRKGSRVHGMWATITQEMINAADDQPPDESEFAPPNVPGVVPADPKSKEGGTTEEDTLPPANRAAPALKVVENK